MLAAAFGRLGRTFREMRRYRHAFLLFLAMLLYQDGIQTIIRMASVYGAEIGIDQNAQIAAFVMVQFLGIPFSFLFGALGARIGTKRALFIALAVYTLADDHRLLHDDRDALLHPRGAGGDGAGRSQALSRALFSRLIPAQKASEFFGFYAVAERFATVLGPLVFTVSVAHDRARAASPCSSSSCSSSPARRCCRWWTRKPAMRRRHEGTVTLS